MKRLALVLCTVLLLAGCAISTALDRDDLGGAFFEPVDVERLPGGGFLAVGCSIDSFWGGVGIVIVRPGEPIERFVGGCQGPMNASPAADGLIFYAKNDVALDGGTPSYEIASLDPDTGTSTSIFTSDKLIGGVTVAPDGRLLFGAFDTAPDASGRRHYRIYEMTGPTTASLLPGTDDLGGADFAVDDDGNIYGTAGQQVFKVSSTGVRTTIAGTGAQGFSGDGGLATLATLSIPLGVDINAQGDVFVADAANRRVRRIGTDGIITTVAGGGNQTADEGLARAALLTTPPRRRGRQRSELLDRRHQRHASPLRRGLTTSRSERLLRAHRTAFCMCRTEARLSGCAELFGRPDPTHRRHHRRLHARR